MVRGGYTLQLVRRSPHKNYIGVDIKGACIWKGAKQVLEEGLNNVRFLRIYIDHLDEYFAPVKFAICELLFPTLTRSGATAGKG